MAGGVQWGGCEVRPGDCRRCDYKLCRVGKQQKQKMSKAISLDVSQSPHRNVKEAEDRGSDSDLLSAMMTRRENG